MKRRTLVTIAILSAACSSTPTNFAGSYAVTVVEGANNCGSSGWTAGSSTNLTAQITQDGQIAQFTIPSNTVPGAYLLLVLGTNTFSGTVTANEFTATYLGTKQSTQGTCTATVNTTLDVKLDANSVLSGTLTFTPVTNGDPSCGVLNQCTNTDTISGSRTGP